MTSVGSLWDRHSLRQILRLALPNIVSNITIPLLALVDVGLAGHLGYVSALGAVAVATTITSTLYWLFGFLRLGTTGFVAQAYGRSSIEAICKQLGRSALAALFCTSLILLASFPIIKFAAVLSNAHPVIIKDAQRYMRVIFWGAPAAMGVYVLNGFFVGMQDTRSPMISAIASNVVNITLSSIAVVFLDMGVKGLAIGTVVAQYANLGLLAAQAYKRHKRLLRFFRWKHFVGERSGLRQFLLVGRDLFFRSAMLSGVTLFFTYAGTKMGQLEVASNTLLLQLFFLSSYFMDGFAYAGEALSGKYKGMRRPERLQMLIRQLFVIGSVLALLCLVLYVSFLPFILGILSNKQEVISHALRYRIWIALVPLMGFAAFLWDGIYVGLTQAKPLRITMSLATAAFFVLYFVLQPLWPGHALWIAFNSYLLLRGIIQTFFYRWRIAPKHELQ